MSTSTHTESDKSIYASDEDYLTLHDYNYSYFNAVKTSQLRMAIVPGTSKKWNTVFEADKVMKMPTTNSWNENGTQIQSIGNTKFTPQVIQKNSKSKSSCNDDFEYSSYAKRGN